MNIYAFTDMERFFMALADRTRLRILNILISGEVCVADLTEVLGESQPKVSRHLAYLRRAGVVETRRDGKWIYYQMAFPENAGLRSILNETLDSLDSFAELKRERGRFERQVNDAVFDNTYGHTNMKSIVHHNELEEFLL